MDLKDLLGESFKENMSVSDVAAALKDKTFVDPSTLPESVAKSVFDKTASELAAAKKQLKEKSSADELAAAAQTEIQEQLTALQQENQRMKLKDSFVGNGYDAKTAAALAEAYSSGDTAKFATLNATYIAAQKETIAAQVKEELLKRTPGIGGGQQTPVDYSKQIEQAKTDGNLALAASLIRQQSEAQAAEGPGTT